MIISLGLFEEIQVWMTQRHLILDNPVLSNQFVFLVFELVSCFYLQEVRLTHLRKLHTECDLRGLASTTTYITHSGGHSGPGSAGSGPGPGPCSGGQMVRPPEEAHLTEHDMHTECLSSCANNIACCNKPSIIDRYSRALFPACFILFNFMYWLTYMNISGEPGESDFIFIK